MSISASLVKELRERTGSGMMECKKALVEANGDIELAIENMRKAGTAKAAKKAGRIAGEGCVVIRSDAASENAVALEVNSETDFVARDEGFKQFAEQVAVRALETGVESVEALMQLPATTGSAETLEDAREALVAKIGENIRVRRLQRLPGPGIVGSYVHGDRIGVLVKLEGGDAELAKDIAMHIAANNPQVVLPEEVSESVIEAEKEIFKAQALESGKPMDIIEKMIGGRVQKFLAEISLVGQPFVKDPSITVEKLLASRQAKVKAFARLEVGEGIEKKTENFAEEVMAQVRGNA